MAGHVSWIKNELTRFFPDADFNKGVDLNRNGEVEESEHIADFNTNGVVGDASDWLEFLKKNEPTIRQLGGIFKWGAAFKPDNPVHDLLSIESEIVGRDEVEYAYKKLQEVLESVKKSIRVFEKTDEPLLNNKLNPQGLISIVYLEGMKFEKLNVAKANGSLFTKNIKEGNLDCDTSSFIVLAIGHELGWPVNIVNVPQHAFVRWDDGKGTRFNIEYKGNYSNSLYSFLYPYISKSDEEYATEFNISDKAIKEGVYLSNLDRNGLMASFLANRGRAKAERGDFKGAIEDYKKALKYNPKEILVYQNIAAVMAVYKPKDFQGALNYIDKAIEMDPNDINSYFSRGFLLAELGDIGAIKDFDKAIDIIKNFPAMGGEYANREKSVAAAKYNRGLAKFKLGDLTGAFIDFEESAAWGTDLAFRNAVAMGFIPRHLGLGVQPRLQPYGSAATDVRFLLGVSWLPIEIIDFKHNKYVGPRFEIGYSGSGKHQMLDLLGGLELSFKRDSGSHVMASLMAGYNFLLVGDDSKVPIAEGAFAQYGVRYIYPLGSSIGIGVSISLQHDLFIPSQLAILGGLEFQYLIW